MSTFWTLVVIVCLAHVTVQTLPQSQYDALADLYASTNGGSWLHNYNWLTGDPCENSWYGVECDSSGTTVVILRLGQNHLRGSLPTTLANLTDVTEMYGCNNSRCFTTFSQLRVSLPDIWKITHYQDIYPPIGICYQSFKRCEFKIVSITFWEVAKINLSYFKIVIWQTMV
jgi:hypothetical protein